MTTKSYNYLFWALIPPVILIIFLVSVASDCILTVQWSLVPFLEKWYSGALTFRDLLMQEGEHRIFFPRMFMLTLAVLTNWNIYYEIAANVVFGAGLFILLFHQLRKLFSRLGTASVIPVFLFSYFTFSLSQSENWFCGYNSIVWINILCAVSVIFMLSSSQLGPKKLAASIGLAVIALYSYGSGLLVWLIGAGILYLRPETAKRIEFKIWSIAALLSIAFYFVGFHQTADNPYPLFALWHPLRTFGHWLVFVGSPILPFDRFLYLIVFFGLGCLAGLGFYGYAVYKLVRAGKIDLLLVLPWACLAGYAIISGMLAAASRAWHGVAQATQSHYVTTANLAWLALIVFIFIATRFSEAGNNSWTRKGVFFNTKLIGISLALFCLLQLLVIKHKWVWASSARQELESAKQAMQSGNFQKYIDSGFIPGGYDDKMSFLKQHRLAVFRIERR